MALIALRHWVLCKLGRHKWVEFVGHTFCLRCGAR